MPSPCFVRLGNSTIYSVGSIPTSSLALVRNSETQPRIKETERKGYTLMAPDAVPMIMSLRLGSQARAVGLLGNPCSSVCKRKGCEFI